MDEERKVGPITFLIGGVLELLDEFFDCCCHELGPFFRLSTILRTGTLVKSIRAIEILVANFQIAVAKVRVDLIGDRDVGVTENHRDLLHSPTFAKLVAPIRVAQHMDIHSLQDSRIFRGSFERLQQGVRVIGFALGIHENAIMSPGQHRESLDALGLQRNSSGAAVLAFSYIDKAIGVVDIFPLQTKRLGATETAKGLELNERPDGLGPAFRQHFQDGFDLFFGQKIDVSSRGLFGEKFGEILDPVHRVGKRGIQVHVNLPQDRDTRVVFFDRVVSEALLLQLHVDPEKTLFGQR